MKRFCPHSIVLSLLALYILPAICEGKPVRIPDSLQVLTYHIGEEEWRMRRVEGGSFIMGATPEQYDPEILTDKPAHFKSVDAFYIAETEVTNALWLAVMPEWHITEGWIDPRQPIGYVSYYDCLEFVRRLDSITGMPFRLPTEAEWEYAARGGEKTKGYRFAGGNNAEDVAWLIGNSGNKKHQVASLRANELGLFDMTGNMSEWCSDWYAPYQVATATATTKEVDTATAKKTGTARVTEKEAGTGIATEEEAGTTKETSTARVTEKEAGTTKEAGTATAKWKIVRGGCFANCAANSHISVRSYEKPDEANSNIGLRVALTLPNEPTLVREVENPPLVKRIRIGGRRVRFVYVAAKRPYYIAEEEVRVEQWRRVTGKEIEGKANEVIVGMSQEERLEFVEQCRRATKEELCAAGEDEILMATEAGVIDTTATSKKKLRHWQRDVTSIQKHRKRMAEVEKWAELVGHKVQIPDDPVLLMFKKKPEDEKPLRLMIAVK